MPLLAIDVGNSFVKFGVFDDEKLLSEFRLSTVRNRSREELRRLVEENLKFSIQAVIISSVVPEINLDFLHLSAQLFNLKPIFVTHDLDFGLPVRYQNPEKLGIDRVVAAFAAREKYGAPTIACDFGTATTIDVVNRQGEFIGGIITPGISLLAEALFQKTSQLPKVKIEKPTKVIADATVPAIQSGVFFGYLGLVEGILRRMFDELGEKPKVVATGGFAKLIAENSDLVEITDEHLMLEGLRLIYKKMKDE